jgi:acyl-CoA hydrolase
MPSTTKSAHPDMGNIPRCNVVVHACPTRVCQGVAVTTTQPHGHWAVTEHGRVNLYGLAVAERARSLNRDRTARPS